jgi:hypothetical protein
MAISVEASISISGARSRGNVNGEAKETKTKASWEELNSSRVRIPMLTDERRGRRRGDGDRGIESASAIGDDVPTSSVVDIGSGTRMDRLVSEAGITPSYAGGASYTVIGCF